jgi:hypothetical protein
MRIVFLFLALSSVVCSAQTPAVCPWLTTGSAESVLGGAVALAMHVDGNAQGNCRFTRANGIEQKVIEIVIGKADTQPCPHGSTNLTALGNEAVQCKTANQGKTVNMIAGRVRDIFFVVSITNLPDAATVPDGPAPAHDSFNASILERVAEQVAGNLY